MTLNPNKPEDRAVLKAVIQEAVSEAMHGGCLCGLDPVKHRHYHELCPVTPEEAADNHRFVRDLRETTTTALKKILIYITAGVVLALLAMGAKAWLRGG